MKRIGWFFQLCKITLSMCWRGYISYLGWAALVHAIGLIVGYAGEYTIIYAMISNFSSIGGFSAAEVLFLYSLGLTCYALGNLHTRRFWQFDEVVQRGELDQYLVRPVSPLLQLFVWDIQVGYLSHLVLGIGSMMALKAFMGLHWDWLHWLAFIGSLLSGFLLMGGIALIATPLTFWWGRSASVAGFMRRLRSTINYPVSIYPDGLRHLLYVIPYAFISYWPCVYLFGKEASPLAGIIPLVCLVAGIVINLLFLLFWRLGLHRYNSAGG